MNELKHLWSKPSWQIHASNGGVQHMGRAYARQVWRRGDVPTDSSAATLQPAELHQLSKQE